MRAQLSAQAEVTYLQVGVVVYKDVCRLQVAMHDSLLVHVLECPSDLTDVFHDSLLWEVDVLLHGLLDDKFQVSLLCPFHGNEELIQLVIYEPVEVLDYIGMI